jgi:glutamate dehydrogenase/leucine dehydrogenase
MYLLGISVLEEEKLDLFGQYKRLRNEFTGILTGKGLSLGGSLIRPKLQGTETYTSLKHAGNGK